MGGAKTFFPHAFRGAALTKTQYEDWRHKREPLRKRNAKAQSIHAKKIAMGNGERNAQREGNEKKGMSAIGKKGRR